jgi:phosphoribosylformylglycinamidine cyclo-ligase
LARKIFFKDNNFKVTSRFPGIKQTLGQELLKTHHSYLKQVYPLLPYVSGIAHITGGGFYENIERLLPKNLSCNVYKDKWQVPTIFKLLQKYGKVKEDEMYKVFNMGIGLVLFARPDNVDKILQTVKNAKIIGEVREGNFGVKIN